MNTRVEGRRFSHEEEYKITNNNDAKRIIFMRHGRALKNTDDYEKMNYDNFMKFLLKKIDPPLLNDYKLIKIPQDIDIIYHSPILRAKQTAELIKRESNNKPVINDKYAYFLNEVKFSEDIILRNEFENNGKFNGITRNTILKKWYFGDNIESLYHSLNKIKKLDYELTKNQYNNILLITHAWLLRLIHLFYQKKIEKKYENITLSNFSLDDLYNAPKYDYGDFLEYFPYSNMYKMNKQLEQ